MSRWPRKRRLCGGRAGPPSGRSPPASPRLESDDGRGEVRGSTWDSRARRLDCRAMKTETVPLALRDYAGEIGKESSLGLVHGSVLRAAHSIRPVVESGAMLAACSDEFNGEVRAAFALDVARMLTAPNIPGTRRVFSVSNLGGRIEPGAVALANLHFTADSAKEGEKLLLIEIASHVGRRETPNGSVWGELDRFGTVSPCCGALQMLLDIPPSAGTVRFPWFDQLDAFF